MDYSDMGALISPCRQYRYTLWRDWVGGSGTVVFIGLNPSTADAAVDDRTAKRCVGFAQRWGYSRLVMVNLFAYRSKKPVVLKQVVDPVGPENDQHIMAQCRNCSQIIAAWGNMGCLNGRSGDVARMLAGSGLDLFCLEHNMNGQPKHPLFAQHMTIPIRYKFAEL